jgi:hypothetical protein
MAIGDQYVCVPVHGKHLSVHISLYNREREIRQGTFFERYICTPDDLQAVIDRLSEFAREAGLIDDPHIG